MAPRFTTLAVKFRTLWGFGKEECRVTSVDAGDGRGGWCRGRSWRDLHGHQRAGQLQREPGQSAAVQLRRPLTASTTLPPPRDSSVGTCCCWPPRSNSSAEPLLLSPQQR